MGGEIDNERHETPEERADRNWNELLQGLRVALPGVQVLFAFLLVVPFNQRFVEVTPFEQTVYIATLLTTALASLFLIAPSVHHRIQFRQRQKEEIVLTANVLAIIGLILLGMAMVGVILLVMSFLLGGAAAAIATGSIALLFVLVWLVFPIYRRIATRGQDQDAAGDVTV
jgi:hypothetical protein